MSNSKHTPGPWSLKDCGYKFIVSKTGDGYITRDVCRMDGSTMAAFAQEANARLIAAAPDLLAVVKQMQSALSRCFGAHAPDEGDRHRALAQARAAIAKATGETK